MNAKLIAILPAAILVIGASPPAQRFSLEAGMAVVSHASEPLNEGGSAAHYKLQGAGSLRGPSNRHYGAMTCIGTMVVSTNGLPSSDTAECRWGEADGDTITWRYIAEPGVPGPGFQHARLEVVAGTGKWRGLAGALASDVMFKPRVPDAPVIFTVATGELTKGERP